MNFGRTRCQGHPFYCNVSSDFIYHLLEENDGCSEKDIQRKRTANEAWIPSFWQIQNTESSENHLVWPKYGAIRHQIEYHEVTFPTSKIIPQIKINWSISYHVFGHECMCVPLFQWMCMYDEDATCFELFRLVSGLNTYYYSTTDSTAVPFIKTIV